jgi:hypothetical protein
MFNISKFPASILQSTALAISLLLFTEAAHADRPQSPKITDRVHDVNSAGWMQFETGDYAKLWGVLIDPQVLRENIVGVELSCFENFGSCPVTDISRCTLICYDRFTDPSAIRDIGEYLILNGKAEEDCPETSNRYGTCDQ